MTTMRWNGPSTDADEPAGAAGFRQAGDPVVQESALHRVLAPRSVAVVGAGRRHGDAGHEAVRAVRDYGFAGRLFAVNRSGWPVCGVPTYRKISDLPCPIDLLVLAVPANQLVRALSAAGRLRARGAVLLGTGRHTDDRTDDRQRREILGAAREHGIRLLGPDCLGVLNTDPRVRLNASLAPVRPPSGSLALAARSGAVGIALLADAVRNHCGVSTFVALGDELDVDATDLLGYWFDDPATRAVALSTESFADPAGFARAARSLGRRKPVLAVTGRRPAAGNDPLDISGVIRTASSGETIEAARMLIDQPLPAGNRLAIVGNASGLIALAADAARGYGFDVVALSADARAKLGPSAGPGRADNPVDLGIDALPDRIADATEMVVASGEADILLPVLAGTRATALTAIRSAVARVIDNHPRVTVAAVLIGSTDEVHRLGRRGAPVFGEPQQAVRALAHARDYAVWRRQPLGRPSGTGSGSSRAVLSAYGICLAPPWHTQSRTGLEEAGVLAAGVRRDPLFGSVVMLERRPGGTAPGDQVASLAPVSERDAARMVRGVTCDALIDTTALETLLVRLGRLADDLPDVAYLDLCPIRPGPDGLVVENAVLRHVPAAWAVAAAHHYDLARPFR